MDLGLGRLARPAAIESDVMPLPGCAYRRWKPDVATRTAWNLRKAALWRSLFG